VLAARFLPFNAVVSRLFLVLGLTTPIACGDPLLSEAASASPLVTIEGYIQPYPVDGLDSPKVTVVWVDPNLGGLPDVAATPDTVRFKIDPQGSFELGLFAPPPAAAGTRRQTLGGGAVQFAFGEIVLYDDVAGVGSPPIGAGDQLIAPDTYQGATPDSVLIYIDSPGPKGAAFIWQILSDGPGYHLGTVDCNAVGPSVIEDANSSTAAVTLQVVPATSQLPYVRTCLQSHPLVGS
jgi:hypothetical protein